MTQLEWVEMQGLSETYLAQKKIKEQPPKEERPLRNCCCDYTAFCPVHSKNGRAAYKFDPNDD